MFAHSCVYIYIDMYKHIFYVIRILYRALLEGSRAIGPL